MVKKPLPRPMTQFRMQRDRLGIVEGMATLMLQLAEEHGHCALGDLRRRGYTQDDIDTHGKAALQRMREMKRAPRRASISGDAVADAVKAETQTEYAY